MKTFKKPFNLEQARKQNGEGLITRDGRPARIIHWDLKNTEKPIVAIITCFSGEEYTNQFRLDGKFYRDGSGESPCDLFLAPTKHEGWVNVYDSGRQYPQCGAVFATKEEADVEACSGRIACTHIEWEE